MQEFITAAREVAEDEDERDSMLEFTLDGRVCYFDKTPPDGALAVLMATTTRHSSTEEKIAGTINFLVNVLDDDSHAYVVSKLLDRKDRFGIDEVQKILSYMIEVWSARPTESPSGSMRSRKNGGQKSKRHTQELTSSGSPSTDS